MRERYIVGRVTMAAFALICAVGSGLPQVASGQQTSGALQAKAGVLVADKGSSGSLGSYGSTGSDQGGETSATVVAADEGNSSAPIVGKGPMEVYASVEPAETTIGEPVTLTVTVTAPELARVSIREPFKSDDAAATWTLQARKLLPDDKVAGGDMRRRIQYTLVAFETGEVPFPPYEVLYQPSSGPPFLKALPRTAVHIKSVLPPDPLRAKMADIKPPVALPIPRWVWILAGLAGAVILALVVWFVWSRLRHRIKDIVRPPKRLDEWALDQFAALEREKLIEHQKFGEFYVRLAETVRSYVGRLYGVRSLDYTTTELMWHLEGESDAPEAARTKIQSLLDEADLVKFARHVPSTHNARHALDGAREMVALTRYKLEPVAADAGAAAGPGSNTGTPPAPPPPATPGSSGNGSGNMDASAAPPTRPNFRPGNITPPPGFRQAATAGSGANSQPPIFSPPTSGALQGDAS